MGGGSQDVYNGTKTLVANFMQGMTTEGNTVVSRASSQQNQNQSKGQSSSASNTGIGIKVTTATAGALFFNGEEVATLWDNDSYTIAIDRPGTYAVMLKLANGAEKKRDVEIKARGIVDLDFSTFYVIGEQGPGGGIVFFVQNGKYKECSATDLGDSVWSSALSKAKSYNGGGYTDWYLPIKDELNLMYTNLKAKGLGGFSSGWYWSSSEYSNSSAWVQQFSDGRQNGYVKNYKGSVRAVRAF
jgi:hypothetical protein